MKHIVRPSLAAVAVIAALGASGVALAQSQTVSKSQASELVGYELASQFPVYAKNLVDAKAVGAAVTRALEGQKPATISESQVASVSKAFGAELKSSHDTWYAGVAAKEKQAGDAYLAKNKAKPGVHVTADGLQYQVITQGSGPRPKDGDTVQVNYTGTFVNGEEFDASSRHGSGPAKLSLGSIIPGFKEAMMLMPVGSHYKFAIPSNLAYGSQPQNQQMPPNATLLFDVTLVKIGE